MNYRIIFIFSILFLLTSCQKERLPENTYTKEYQNITLKKLDNETISLSTALNNQPTVLIFYRGDWCPYCNVHLKDMKTIEKELIDLGYQIIAISPDKASELAKTHDKLSLSYTLLSDSKMNAAKYFDLAFTVDDKTIEKYTTYGIDLERSSGEKHHSLPVPSVLVISKDGRVVYKHSDKNYKVRLKSGEILELAKKHL